jgi:uncharacterized coiled-coil protein SlyX
MEELRKEFTQEMIDQKEEAETQHQQLFEQYEHQIKELKKEYEEILAQKDQELDKKDAKIQRLERIIDLEKLSNCSSQEDYHDSQLNTINQQKQTIEKLDSSIMIKEQEYNNMYSQLKETIKNLKEVNEDLSERN